MESPELRQKGGSRESVLTSRKIETRREDTVTPRERTSEDLDRIEDLRNILKKNIDSELPAQTIIAQGSGQEVAVANGRSVSIEYVSGDTPVLAYSDRTRVFIRKYLPPTVQDFVKARELYYCTDRREWGGRLGKRIRATIMSGFKNPVGMIAAAWMTVSDAERVNSYFNKLISGENYEIVPQNIDTLERRLRKYSYSPEGVPQEEKENYLRNIVISEELQTLIADYPDNFDLIFSIASKKVYTQEDMKAVVSTVRARQEEKIKNEQEVRARILENPLATAEEYDLGVFREQLETQVRDAVFELHKKGYKPIGSGFDNLSDGTQSIVLEAQGVNVDVIRGNMPPNVAIVESRKEIVILFKPKNGATIQDLKQTWDTIAHLIPPSENGVPKLGSIDNGRQGIDFRKAQDRIKLGKDAWLGHGFAFMNGKVVEVPRSDFNTYRKRSRQS